MRSVAAEVMARCEDLNADIRALGLGPKTSGTIEAG
jgi:hypothetical protein